MISKNASQKFNLRVYGILINEKNEVLVSDEQRFNHCFTKFPGGGLEWGEGILDALKREFLEELELEITIQDLFYLTDYFQVSAFNENDQVISIYYLVSSNDLDKIKTNQFIEFSNEKENHRWICLSKISENDFTFAIDKKVAKLLKSIR